VLGGCATDTLRTLTSLYPRLQCSPPNSKCMTTFRALERWERSATGRACFANADAIQSDPVGASVQAHSTALCTSKRCGQAMSTYISALEGAGCTHWSAYRLKRVQYDVRSAASHSHNLRLSVCVCVYVFTMPLIAPPPPPVTTLPLTTYHSYDIQHHTNHVPPHPPLSTFHSFLHSLRSACAGCSSFATPPPPTTLKIRTPLISVLEFST
jgi:hypothetical protein